MVLALEPLSTPLSGIIGSPMDIAASIPSNTVQAAPQVATASTAAAPMPAYAPQAPVQPAGLVDPKTGQSITPIKMLDTYTPRWLIRARVSNKSEIKTYNNDRGPGQLFSVTLLDETGEIRATLFNEAVDKFYPIFAEGGMYMISGGKLKFANKKFTTVKHAYELTLGPDASVQPIDSVESVPHMLFDFQTIDNIQDCKKDDMIDVIGVLLVAKPVTTIPTKKGETARRSLVLADHSNRSIELTLWGDQATSFDEVLNTHGANPIIAAKGVKVSDFGGRTLSALHSSEFDINPEIAAGQTVRRWFAGLPDGGKSIPSLSSGGGGGGGGGGAGREKTLSSIQLEGLGHNATPDYLTVPNIYITNFKKDGTLWYKACANPDCKGKKVFEENGQFRCPTCQGVNNTRLRWVANFQGYDHTGREYISGFGEAGTTLIGHEAEAVEEIQARGDSAAFAQIWDQAKYRSYTMRLAAKYESYQDTSRLKLTVQSVTPIDYVKDSERLLERIYELQKH